MPASWRDTCKPAFLSIGLLFAPTQSALHVSNVAGLSASLLLIALYLLLEPPYNVIPTEGGALAGATETPASSPLHIKPAPRSIPIATLITLSLCIKPTLAPIVLLYLFYKKAWTTLTTTIALTTGITAAFQLLQPNLNWLVSLRSNMDFLFTRGVASLAEQNLTRSDRIDLQLPVYTLTHSRTAAAAIAIVVSLTLLTVVMQSIRKTSAATLDRNLLILSTLLVIGLLPLYQRFYSATLLLLPVLWALRNLSLSSARWILVLCCIFLANTSVLPRRLGLHTGRVEEVLLTPHLSWILLLLALFLLNALRRHLAIPMAASSAKLTES